jgi:ATP-dependent helicase/nuclease subunit A
MNDNSGTNSIDFTRNQKKAITTLDRNLCVTAGAGSGKTTVLVERYLHLLDTKNLSVQEIVAITFTEKAAKQMKEKIRQGISERIENTPSGRAREVWLRRHREIGSAWIHTIHGLCTRVLREHAVEAGIDPHSLILNDTETLILRHKVVRSFVIDRLNGESPSLSRLLTAYGLGTTQELLTCMLHEREKIADWGARNPDLSDDAIVTPCRNDGLEKIWVLKEKLRECTCDDPSDKMEQLRQEVLAHLAGGVLNGEILSSLAAIKLQGGSKKKWGEAPLKRVREIFTQVRDLAMSLLPLFDEARTSREIGLLRDLLLEFNTLGERYLAEKNGQGIMDFDDLLILARDLLREQPAVTAHYRKAFQTLLIDELQDTDPIQMEIVKLITADTDGRLFAVGDAKQSIYRFRGADVSVFQRFRRELLEQDPEAVVPLNRNFRSQSEVLTFINHLFSRIFQAEPGAGEEVGFEPLEPYKASVNSSHVAESFFIVPDSQTGLSAHEARRTEAAWIATRIAAMVSNREERIYVDENAKRAVQYGDIAILFRAMTDVKLYENALRLLSIPFTVLGGAGFFAKQEVLDVLNLLRVLLYPNDEVALAGILRSPCVGVKDETLYFLTRGRRLSQGLGEMESNRQLDETERQLLRRARKVIDKLRSVRDRVRIPELIGRFLDMTGYPALLLTDPVNGVQRYANIRKLMDLARDFSSRPFFGLSDFIDYVEELKTKEAREAESPVDEEDRDTVRILTIHRAKGLEFPVVILPDLSRQGGGHAASVAIDPDLGIGIKVPNDRGTMEDGTIRSCILKRSRAEEIQEEKRLFYVAATRAQDFLILSGQLAFPRKRKAASHVAMDWVKDALEITEENCLEDIPYNGRQVKVFTKFEETHGEIRAADAWIDRYPGILRGQALETGEDGEVQALITRYTVSQLLLYHKCPKGYELSVLRGISEPEAKRQGPSSGKGGRDFGSLVHNILQQWDMGPASLEACVDRQLFRAALTHQRGKKMRAEALKILEAFSHTETAEDIRCAAHIHSETPFLLKVGPYQIEGVIDRIYRNRVGRLTIIDYKTDRATSPELPEKAEEYRFQLAAYALAAQTLFGEPADTALVFLHPGITYPLKTDPAETETEILSLIEGIRSSGTFEMNRRLCPNCGYGEPFCTARESSE